jgi:hypothetical protein
VTRLLTVLVLVAACQGDASERQHASLGSIRYDMPLGWHRDDRGPRSSVWAPDENPRKETVTIIRAELDPALATRGVDALAPLLAKAQGTLRGVSASPPEPVSTSHGMQGFRVALHFTPIPGAAPYTRVHALLVRGRTLLHVIYTAASPDDDEAAMKLVLDTAHEKG